MNRSPIKKISMDQPRVKNLLAAFETRISHNEGTASSGMYLTNNLRSLSGESKAHPPQRKRDVKKIARNKSTDSSDSTKSYPPKSLQKKRRKDKKVSSKARTTPSSSVQSVVTSDVKPKSILKNPKFGMKKPKSILKAPTIGVKPTMDGAVSDLVSLSTSSMTSRTASLTENDGSTIEGMNEILEKLAISPRKRGGRVEIPASIDEEHEECVGLTVAWEDSESSLMDDDDASVLSNGSISSKIIKCSRIYKGGVFGHGDEESEGSSQPSISRSSSRVRELPRDMAFDSDDDRISDEESDKVSEQLRKARGLKQQVQHPPCRFW